MENHQIETAIGNAEETKTPRTEESTPTQANVSPLVNPSLSENAHTNPVVNQASTTELQSQSVSQTVSATQSLSSHQDTSARPKESIMSHIMNELSEEKKGKERTLIHEQTTIRAQKSAFTLLMQRVDSGIQTCDVMLKYFTERASIAQNVINSIKLLPDLHAVAELGSMEMALDYTDRISTSEMDNQMKFVNTINDNINKQLSSLILELTSSRKKLGKEEKRLNKDLDQLYNRTAKAFDNLEKALMETKSLVETSKDINRDPWLNQIECYDCINQLYLRHTEYNKQLVEIYQEVEKLDRKRIDTIKSLLKGFVAAQKTCYVKIVADIDVASNSVEHITSNDWNQYTQQMGLTKAQTGPFQNQQGPTPSQQSTAQPAKMLQPFSSKSVIKVGQLELGGLFRWKTYFFTLSKFGFLHYFSNTQKLEPEGTIPIFHCEVTADPSKNSFYLNYSPPSFFSSGTQYLLRASKEIEMVEWVIELKRFANAPPS